MTDEEALQVVSKAIRDMCDISDDPPVIISLDTRISEDLFMDDLDRVEVLLSIEDVLDCSLDIDVPDNWETVSDIVKQVKAASP